MTTVVWTAGLVLLAIVLAQGIVTLYSSIRRAATESHRQRLAIELMQQRVASARRHRVELDHSTLTWRGIRKFEVTRRVVEAEDICSFYLLPHDRNPIPAFRPGQYLTFDLAPKGKNKRIVRCYSLSDSPARPYYRVTIKRLAAPAHQPELPEGLGSNHFHHQVSEGDILDVRAPSGHFSLDTSTETPIVLIGGGIGITPLLSMLSTVAETGSARETWLLYGVRHRDEHIMADHLRETALQHDNVHVHICYSDVREGIDEPGRDYDHMERISVDLLKRLLPSNNYDFFICGPPPMMASITTDLADWGVPEDRVHYETFGPASVKKLRPATTPTAAAESFDITFSRAGTTCAWDPACESLLDFAESQGVVIESGCRAGNCGTCLTAIRSGEIEYTTEPGADPEAGSCLTCICVPKGPLVLDA